MATVTTVLFWFALAHIGLVYLMLWVGHAKAVTKYDQLLMGPILMLAAAVAKYLSMP